MMLLIALLAGQTPLKAMNFGFVYPIKYNIMMTIEEFKKIPVKYRLIFIANSLDKYGEGSMREWWQNSRDCFRYLDAPTWKKLSVGRSYMVDVWNEVCDNHPHSHYPKRSKESLFA